MSDLLDNAQEQEAVFLNVALSKRNQSLPYIGKCHWCDEPVQAHFCDTDCRDDYEKNRRIKGV